MDCPTEARARAADKMAREIAEYVAGEHPGEVDFGAIAEADAAWLRAAAAYEEGQGSYADLEAAGVAYVEAYGGATNGAKSARHHAAPMPAKP